MGNQTDPGRKSGLGQVDRRLGEVEKGEKIDAHFWQFSLSPGIFQFRPKTSISHRQQISSLPTLGRHLRLRESRQCMRESTRRGEYPVRLSQLFWYLNDSGHPSDGDRKSCFSHLDITDELETLRRRYPKGLPEHKIGRLKDEVQLQLHLSESE